MFGSGYGLGLIVAFLFGLLLEYLRRKHYKQRINLKRKQRFNLLEKKIAAKRASMKVKSKDS